MERLDVLKGKFNKKIERRDFEEGRMK